MDYLSEEVVLSKHILFNNIFIFHLFFFFLSPDVKIKVPFASIYLLARCQNVTIIRTGCLKVSLKAAPVSEDGMNLP